MVLRVDVVDAALRDAYGESARRPRSIVLAPSGRRFDDALAAELARRAALALLCGRYEGVDERVREHLADDAISIGRYVLAGGELAAMVVADAVLRKLPGALGHAESAIEESFSPALGRRARVPALHAARRAIAAGTCPRSCFRATTRRCASGGLSRAARAGPEPLAAAGSVVATI